MSTDRLSPESRPIRLGSPADWRSNHLILKSRASGKALTSFKKRTLIRSPTWPIETGRNAPSGAARTRRQRRRLQQREEAMSGKIKRIGGAGGRAVVPAMAADMAGRYAHGNQIGGDLSLQRTGLVDRSRRPRSSCLRAIRQRPWRHKPHARSIILLGRRLQSAESGRARPQTCRRRRGRVHLQPVGTPGNSASAKYLTLKGVPTIAIVFRIEQVHRCHGFPARQRPAWSASTPKERSTPSILTSISER